MQGFGVLARGRRATGLALLVLACACGTPEVRDEPGRGPVPQSTLPPDGAARGQRDEASARLDRALSGESVSLDSQAPADGETNAAKPKPVERPVVDAGATPEVAAAEPPRATPAQPAMTPSPTSDGDLVAIEAEATGKTRQDAVDAAVARAKVEASQRRVSQIHSESVDILTDRGDDSFSQITNLVTSATLAGVEPEVLGVTRGRDDFTAHVRIRVPREQLEPARWYEDARTRPDATTVLRDAVTRARERHDVQAEVLGLRHLLDLGGTRVELETLVGRLLELGLYQAADTELLAWSARHADDAGYVDQRRHEVAAGMRPAADRIRDLLADVQRRRTGRLDLGVLLKRTTAQDVQTVSGNVAPGAWLALVWIDAESLSLYEVLTPDDLQRNARKVGAAPDSAGRNFAVDFDFRASPGDFVPGEVQLLAIRVEDPSQLPSVPRPIDLVACAGGDLAEMQRLVAVEASLREAALAEAHQTRVLRWTQEDR
ncbi:MAG: hypothetical protein H6825_05055 [Planctomycetes bacterium]|nr:hypothetical protein [Planctomycetota bacterium]